MTDSIRIGSNHAEPGAMPVGERRPMAVKSPDPGGRPTVMTPEVLQKLEAAFMNTFTDAQACDYAGISPSTLYNYQAENPAFLERKTILRERPDMRAKIELVGKIEGNLEHARWWAQHRMSAEFAAKTKLEHTLGEQSGYQGDAARRVAVEFEGRLKEAIIADAKGGKKP